MKHLNRQTGSFLKLPLVPEGDRISKTIYQIYLTGVLPKLVMDNISRIKKLNPTWTHKVFNNFEIEEFIDHYYGQQMLGMYRKINPKYGAARADLFRYLLMYQCGGVYLDIKASVVASFDSILLSTDRYILAQWGPGDGEDSGSWGRHAEIAHVEGGEFQQWHIIATAGHPFLRSVLIDVLDNIQSYDALTTGVGRMAVLKTTGPIAYTLAIQPMLNQAQFRLVGSSRSFGLIYSGLDASTTKPIHFNLFKQHYSQLTEPLILSSGL
jgi:inositol phosphorylceramide mannosyltransferase catalytic subunit